MTAAPSARATQAGILLMISASLTFGAQDGLSRLLAESYGPVTVIAIRFWFFALFVLAFAATRPGGIRRVAKSKRPVFQTLRGLLLITQICTAVYGFTMVGLVGYQVIFASYPLMVAALSVHFLGERVGWRRWLAISAETSFFWTGIVGAAGMSLVVPLAWSPLQGNDWIWMATLCLASTGGHFLLTKAFDMAEASVLQPFAYIGVVTSAVVGFLFFADPVTAAMLTGGGIVIAAGLFTFWRERVQARAAKADNG